MYKSRLMAEAEASEDEVVRALREEVWRLGAELPRVRRETAVAMRKSAVDTFRNFAKQNVFTDEDVIKALEALPLPEDGD